MQDTHAQEIILLSHDQPKFFTRFQSRTYMASSHANLLKNIRVLTQEKSSSHLFGMHRLNLRSFSVQTIQFETMPKYIRGLFQMRNTERKLRGSRKLFIPYVIQYNHLWSSFLQIYFCKHVEQTNRGPEVINVLE